ncbi:MAG: MBL fold metallo-hydrolase [Clostridiales bacterium]|nr:MBL fold metallo-hydrolase [Clostridiales bacterium]
MPKLYYQGHGSYRLTTNDGRVIYVDPYAGDGYDKPADIVLVTHQHGDHNQVQLVTQKSNCRVITNEEALAGGKHNTFDVGDIHIEAVEAKNPLHSPKECVGFIIIINGVSMYCSGDTSKTTLMESFASRKLDWAIFCGDGKYNMAPKEAAECARIVGAKHNIIVHVAPGKLFDRAKAEEWDAPNKVIVEPGEEIEL